MLGSNTSVVWLLLHVAMSPSVPPTNHHSSHSQGSLSWGVTTDMLRNAFAKCGDCIDGEDEPPLKLINLANHLALAQLSAISTPAFLLCRAAHLSRAVALSHSEWIEEHTASGR